MENFDVTRKHEALYTASDNIEEVTARRGVFLGIEGSGALASPAVDRAVELLFAVARALRRELRKAVQLDFTIPKLEAQWFVPPGQTPTHGRWQLLLRIPGRIPGSILERARRAVTEETGLDTSGVRRVTWREGHALQTMHIGPHARIGVAYERLRNQAAQLGVALAKPAHEIYITDPRHAGSRDQETIVRLPIAESTMDRARRPLRAPRLRAPTPEAKPGRQRH